MARKRPPDEVESSKKVKKVKKDDEFTGLKFKLELKTSNDVTKPIETYLETIEKLNSGDGARDIVDEYLRATDDVSELVALLQPEPRRKPGENAAIFKVLHSIFVRTADDLTSRHVTKLANQVLARLDLVYHMLQQKAEQIKITLKLLTSIVIQDYSLARDVLLQFDFQHRCVMPLLSRRNYLDEEDCRSCLMSFYLSFIIHGDTSTVQHFLQMKGVLNSIFPNLTTDHVTILEILLPTLLERIVKEPSINKTLKLRIFDASTLEHLAALYRWQGPSRYKDKDQPVMPAAEHEEQAEKVADLVDELLTELCCSHKNGINFYDKTLGLGAKNHNPVLTTFLLSQKFPDDLPRLRMLLINILVTCPDVISRYLTSLQHEFEPRLTTKWVDRMKFLNELYSRLPEVPSILEKNSPSRSLVSACMVTLCPPQIVLNSVVRAIKDKFQPHIRHVALETLNAVLANLRAVIDQTCGKDAQGGMTSVPGEGDVRKASGPAEGDVREFVDKLKEAVVKVVPDFRSITSCWYFLMNPPKEKPGTPKHNANVPVHAAPAAEAMYGRVMTTILYYQTLIQDYYPDQVLDLSMLIDGVQQCVENSASVESMETDEEIRSEGPRERLASLCVGLLKVMSETDGRRIPWGKKNKAGKSLIYQVLSMSKLTDFDVSLSKNTIALIAKLLSSTDLFEDQTPELLLWLRRLPSLTSDMTSHVLAFLDKVLTSLMANAQIYYDQIAEAVATSSRDDVITWGNNGVAMETGDSDESNEDRPMQEDENQNETIESILALDYEELERRVNCDVITKSYDVTNSSAPVSAMVPASLKVLKQWEDAEVESYVSAVLLDVFHSQTTPVAMITLLERYSDSLPDNELLPYMETYRSGGIKKTRKVPEFARTHPHRALIECRLSNKKRKPYVEGAKNLDESLKKRVNFEDEELANLLLNHILLCLQSPSEEKDGCLLSWSRVLCSAIKPLLTSHPLKLTRQLLSHPFIRLNFLQINDTVNMSSGICDILGRIPDQYVSELKNDFAIYKTRLLENHAAFVPENVRNCVRFLNPSEIRQFLSIDGLRTVILDYILEANIDVGHFDYSMLQGLTENLTADSAKLLIKIVRSNHIYSACLRTNVIEDILTTKMTNSEDSACYKELLALALKYGSSEETRKVVREWLGEKVRSDKELGYLEVTAACVDELYSREDLDVEEEEELNTIAKPYCRRLKTRLQNNSITPDQLDVYVDFTMRFDVLPVGEFCRLVAELTSSGAKINQKVVDFMTKMVEKASQYCEIMDYVAKVVVEMKGALEEKFFRVLVEFIERFGKESTTVVDLRLHWPQLSRSVLKHRYTSPAALRFLATCLTAVTSSPTVTSPTQVDVTALTSMVTSHSQFVETMMKETGDEAKDALVDILMTSCERSEGFQETSFLLIVLGAYSASLHTTDQRLLRFVAMLEKNGADLKQFRPFMWGRAGLDHMSSQRNLGPSLISTTGDQVISLLDAEKLAKSAVNFPIHRKLRDCSVEEVKLRDDAKSTDVYDPCFLLPLFSSLLRSDTVLHLRDFVERGCVGYIVSSLSSHCPAARGAAYLSLARLAERLEGARFRESQLVVNVLSLVQHSVKKNERLPGVVTLFWAKSMAIIMNPDSFLYSQINNFLLLKPSLDVHDVPEFYKFFNSVAIDHKQERSWMLALLSEAVRDVSDYAVFQRRHVFTLLACFHDSCMAEERAKVEVIGVLCSCVRVPGIAQRLVKNHGLLSWLAAAVSNSVSQSHLVSLSNCLCDLWSAMTVDRAERRIPLTILDAIFLIAAQLLSKLSSENLVLKSDRLITTMSDVIRDVESRDKYPKVMIDMESHDRSPKIMIPESTIYPLIQTWRGINSNKDSNDGKRRQDLGIDILIILTHNHELLFEESIDERFNVLIDIADEHASTRERFLKYMEEFVDKYEETMNKKLEFTFRLVSVAGDWKEDMTCVLWVFEELVVGNLSSNDDDDDDEILNHRLRCLEMMSESKNG